MTLLYLDKTQISAKEIDYILYTARTSLNTFSMPVDRRGVLGDKKADVYFLKPNRSVEDFRSYALANLEVHKAYLAMEQYPNFTPHVTLGYPDKPANDKQQLFADAVIYFDRIAIWDDDYSGPEVFLESPSMKWSEGVSMTNEDLVHFGVKGMHWGVKLRRTPKALSDEAATPEARAAAQTARTIKSKGVHTVTNAELQNLVTRMNLEQQYSRLKATPSSGGDHAKKFVTDTLVSIGKQQGTKLASDLAAKQIAAMLKQTATR
jgi:hypothetical protein